MSLLTISIASIILNIILLGLITYLMLRLFKERTRANKLANELGSDSLEHYLNEIKKRGFEYTLKPKGDVKGKKKD